MKILHTSDLHSTVVKKIQNIIDPFDVWLDTGDFFPNQPLMENYMNNGRLMWKWHIDKDYEKTTQKEWLIKEKILDFIVSKLNGRPFVSVSGNHDFISLADQIKSFGYENVYEVSPKGFELLGYKWAGFPNVNSLGGVWNHESIDEDFDALIEKIKKEPPDLLITHAPPHGMLDNVETNGNDSVGIKQLTNFLSYGTHKIHHHFFGHIHEQGGMIAENKDIGIKFINGACNALIHTL